MASQTGVGIRDLSIGHWPIVLTFVAMFSKLRSLAESNFSIIKRLICGLMFSSAAVLPSIYPASLGLRGLYLLDFGIFVASTILFAVLNGGGIAQNAKYTLAGSIVIGTLVLMSQHISLEAFAPYIPMSVAMSLLLTIYVVPWIRTSLHQRYRITLGEYISATRGDNLGGSYQVAVDPASVRSVGGFRGNLNRIIGWGPNSLEFQHMDHLDQEYQRARRPGSPANDSSVDLESGLHQVAESSIASAGSRDPFISGV